MIQDKNTIRKQILAQRSSLTVGAIKEAGTSALNDMIGLRNYQDAKTVMLYMDFRSEVPTGELIAHVIASGKRLVLPLTDKRFAIIPYEIIPKNGLISDSFIVSSFGISEPNPTVCHLIDPTDIDLVIVPGVAFDKAGNRLGYGKGCYDRFLPLLREDAYKVGLAYNLQVLDSIPSDPTDIKMDSILSV